MRWHQCSHRTKMSVFLKTSKCSFQQRLVRPRMWWHGQREGRWRVHLQNVIYPLPREKSSSSAFNFKNLDHLSSSFCQAQISATQHVALVDSLSNQSFCKSRPNFVFKCWICHFGTKLFSCKLYPGGANARRHPNALALKKAVWLQEPEKKN